MNKIFKVIYSKTRHCYVVVSELAKSHCKTTQSHTARSKTALTAAVLIALGGVSFITNPEVAYADTKLDNGYYIGISDANNDRTKDDNANGKGAGGTDSITIGHNSTAGTGTITIGDRRADDSKYSVYLGEHYDSANQQYPDPGNYVTSIGYDSDARGKGSIALGSGAEADVNRDLEGKKKNPDADSASVAIGYQAKANKNNIAIGANSMATGAASTEAAITGQAAPKSYVSVGDGIKDSDTQYRRISNVADGANASDVATVGQLQALAAKSGTYKAGFGIEITPDTAKKENTIKLNRNLGRDMDSTDKATLGADESKSALVLGGRVEEGQSKKGQVVEKPYGAFGQDSVVVGGANNIADKDGAAAVVIGGTTNTASAQYSTVAGGNNNDAFGNESSVFGGFDNDAFGAHATLSGGSMNKAHGEAASVFGGAMNSALGASSVAVGGLQSTVNGAFAVGLAGGSTNADYALAAGNGANVTVENGTAIGYQATANKEGTIAFGHDKGDVSTYTVTWEKRTDGKTNADGTDYDYTKPIVKADESKNYTKAYYNRLVKVADGVDAHDVVVMEQLDKAKTELTKDLSVNAGWGINIADEKDPKTGEVTKKNTISLNRNLGTNYGNLGWGEGKVTFEASGQNSLILGGAASVSEYDHNSDVKAGVYGKDSVLVGGFNNLIGREGETSVIVGGQENQVTNQKSVIVGGFGNKVTGSTSVVVGGVSNEASGSGDGVFGGFRNEVSGMESVVLGGQTNKVTGMNSVVSGGTDNQVSGHYASANGGNQNTISGNYAATLGGFNNQSEGMFSNAIGGDNNITSGQYSTTSGGSGNIASGDNSYIGGGGSNQAAGVGASVFGGYRSKVNGNLSTGVGGGSTNNRATATLAAGYQSMVTDGGVAYRSLTSEERSKINKGQQYWPGFSGILVDNNTKVLDRISTAIGYQAAADAPGVISFGHDKGDESSENGRYSSAYYNRLVKAADGIEDHDAVVMEQLKNASDVGSKIKVYQTDENGNIKFDKNNNPIEDTSDSDDVKTRREAAQKASEDAWGKAIGTGKIADPTKSDTNDPEANGSQQLVTGGTVYTEVRPATDGTYVKTKNTTAANLTALDKQVAANTTKLGDKNHNIKYYSVKDKTPDDKLLPSIPGYLNDKNDGAKGAGSMAAGFNTHADGVASTVAGSYSSVVGTGLQGAAALSYGTFNVNQNAAQAGTFSGVANSIVGQANVTTDSNAAIIYGAGNTVKNSYRDIDTKNVSEIMAAAGSGDVTKLGEALQKAVPTSGGQVMVMGGGNNVESAYMSQVVGVGNTVKGNQVKNTKGEWGTDTSDTAIKDYDPEKSSQYNYVDGFNNEVINGKHDYIIGANNKLDGDSYDDNNAKPIKRSNKSNVVIGDNHALTGKKNNVIIGSADTEGTLTRASDAVIIGHKANATSDTGADNAVAIGLSATAGGGNAVTIGVNTSAGENSITIGSESSAISGENIAIGRYAKVKGYEVTKAVALGQMANALVADGVAIGSDSIATVAGNSVEGYDPTTGQTSKDTTATWKATKAAVSIGTADGKVTRQINGVAAGTNDTDAVNVAQIKKLASVDASNIGKNFKDGDVTTNENAWGEALGTGTVRKDSKQLVTGGTVYNEVRPSKDGEYVKMSQTTSANLLKLDNQVKTNTDKLSDVDSRSVKYDTKTENGKTVVDNTKITLAGEGGTTITNLKAGVNDNDAATVGQLNSKIAGVTYTAGNGIAMDSTAKTISAKAGNGITVDTNGINAKSGTGITVDADGINVNTGNHLNINANGKIDVDDSGEVAETGDKSQQLVTGKTVYDALHGGLDNITVGKDGKDGKDGSIGIAGRNGTNGYTMTIIKTEQGAAGVDGKGGITRIVYQDKDDTTGKTKQTVATLDDGLKFAGDDAQTDASKAISKKLNNTIDIVGGATGTLTDGNIGVNNVNNQLKIQLAKDLKGMNSTEYTSEEKTGEGDQQKTTTTINSQGLTITNGPSITKDGINAGNKAITKVASGLGNDNQGSYNKEQNGTNAANLNDVNKMITDATASGGTIGNELYKKANVDATNIGTNLSKIPVTDANGNIQYDESGAIKLRDATDDDKTANENAWGNAIGTGHVANPTEVKDSTGKVTNDPTKNGSQQLITGGEVYNALHGGLDDVVFGHDGKDGKDGSIGLVGPKGQDGKDGKTTTIIKTETGAAGVNGKDGKDGITRIVYNDKDNPTDKHTVATLDDGMKYAGDTGDAANVALNHQLKLSGTTFGEDKVHKSYDEKDWTSDNIAVVSDKVDKDGNAVMNLKLSKDLKDLNSSTYTTTETTGEGDQQKTTTYTTIINGKGLTIQSGEQGSTTSTSGPSITIDGIDGGGKAITNIGSGIEKDNKGNYTDKSKSSAANINDVQTIVNDAKKDLTDGKNGLNNKANVDASNIGENLKDADGRDASTDAVKTNKDAWASAIGTNEVKEGNNQLVTSDAVAKELAKKADKSYVDQELGKKADKTYVDEKLDTKANKSDVYTKTEVDSKVADITNGLGDKANKDLDNISDKGKTVIKNLAKGAVKVIAGTNTTITEGKDGDAKTYAVNVENGKVASGDTGLISGDTLYKEVHVDKDGSYIKGSQTVGQNLSALDSGLKTTSDLIHTNTKGDTIQIGGSSSASKIDVNGKDGKGRVITGVVSDANDPNSAANVGYVNGLTAANTQQIYRDMNNAYSRLDTNINRAAAGSNALAALHPLDFDPADKASFAVGYGHYRNANAAAVGAFYQPNANTMVNMGISLGNGDPGFNAGVSFKIGKGSAYNGVSKAEMAQTIHDQATEISAIKADDAAKDKRIDALEKENQEMKKQIQEILARLNG